MKATKKADKKVEEGLINSLIGKSVSHSRKAYKTGELMVYFCEVKEVIIQKYMAMGFDLKMQPEVETWVVEIVEKNSDKKHPFNMQIELGHKVPLTLAFVEKAMKKYNAVLQDGSDTIRGIV